MKITGWWIVVGALTGCIESAATADPEVDGAVDGAPGALDAAPLDAANPDAMAQPDADAVPPPCIRVEPDRLEFEYALVGRTTTRPVMIESCGGQPLEVTRVFLTPESSATLAVADDSAFELPATATPPPTRMVEVTFAPPDRAAYGGTLVIESNDPTRPRIEVPIVGRGTMNECPVAVAAPAEIRPYPLEIIELVGSASTDIDGPDGVPVRHEWTVVERPEGSTAQPVERFQNPRDPANTGLPDDPSTPDALFFVDLAGRYVIELVVEDTLQTTAPSDTCPQAPARVVIEAAYLGGGFHVELVWDTPADLDQTDEDGTDMDLHLRHPSGRGWAQAPFDCYFANGRPDWGPPGPAGDPSLDLDDVNGAGPELISLRTPEDTEPLDGSYCIGVDYYRAENHLTGGNWGPSTATVRVFLDGVLASEQARLLEATHHFWEANCITWGAGVGAVEVVDRTFNGVP